MLLLHGYPETKRIWWRNIAPLAAAGFEVIVPDLRGYGDSDLSANDVYDLALYSRDVHALVHDVLGHQRCLVAGGDIGGVVGVDLVHRFGDFVERFCFFNTVPPAAIERVRGRRPRLRVVQRAQRRADRRLPRAAGRAARRARRRCCRRRRGAPAVDRGHVQQPVVGVAGDVHARRRRLHDRAVRRRGAAARRLGGLPARARPAHDRAAAAGGHGRRADAAALRHRRPRGRRGLRAVLRARVHRPHRSAAHPGCRPLPPVGARRHLQPAADLGLRRADVRCRGSGGTGRR